MNNDRYEQPEFPSSPIDVVAAPILRFIHTEAASGVALLAAVVLALVLANSPLSRAFEAFWQTRIGLHVQGAIWDRSLRHWVNDGLMTLFFFVAGLEIKREIAVGELREPKAIATPFIAAIGGMLVPAALYLAISGPHAAAGWGSVTTTDIAFVVGCLALLKGRIPDSLRAFVLALAIFDDIGAVTVITLGYAHGIHTLPLFAALGGLAMTLLMGWLGVRHMAIYWILGVATWAALHESGIHPSVAGVALGLLTPARPWLDTGRLNHFLDWASRMTRSTEASGGTDADSVRQVLVRATEESVSPLNRLEHRLHALVAFVILPLFALANAGVMVTRTELTNGVALATIAGLVLGKPLGIFSFTWIAVKLKLAHLPRRVSWSMLLAAGALSGIGFTMAIFIAQLAFQGAVLHVAKLGILVASVIAGALGTAALGFLGTRPSQAS